MERKTGIEVPTLCTIEAPLPAIALLRPQVFSKPDDFEKAYPSNAYTRKNNNLWFSKTVL
jgi:hypothetical protein